MRVVLSQYEGIDATPVLPLAAGCLISAARLSLPRNDYAIAIERQPVSQAVRELNSPDIFGVSLYPWNAAYSLAVARELKTHRPAAFVIAGGPSVPRRPDRAQQFLAAHPEIDLLAMGEGEEIFPKILSGIPRDQIHGLAWQGGASNPPQRIANLAATTSPFLDGTFDELIRQHRHRFSMALLETNRGCPFSCTFCDWSLTKKVAEFPMERVHAELEWVTRHGFSHIMLADANFGIRPRDLSIARKIADLRQATGNPRTFYFYLTKNNHARNLETIEILQQAQIGTWVGLAVQDFDDDVLEAVKRDNIQTGEALKLRAICGDRGIPTFHELILGLPGQTYESFRKTIAAAMPPIPRHDFVLFLCRLIENAELGSAESRERYGIETRHCLWKTSTPGWDSVIDEYQEVVVATNDMPIDAWRRTYRLAWLAAAFYNLRLLREVLARVEDIEQYLERLAGHCDVAPEGSVYSQLRETIHRYAETLLHNGPFVLPYPGCDTPLPIDEAIAMQILAGYDDFLAETQALTPGALTEAFRYQRFITPVHGRTEPIESHFSHGLIRYTPTPSAALPRFADFAAMHFSLIRSRLDSGKIEVCAAPSPSPSPLVLLASLTSTPSTP